MLTSVPRSDCSAAREAASARLDGELSEHAAAQLDAHLAECTECRMYAASIAELAGTLRFASLEPVTVRLFEPRRRRPHVRVRVAAAAVVLAAATGGSFAIGEMLGSQDSTPQGQVGTTLAFAKRVQPQVARAPADLRPIRMPPTRVIAV